MSLLKFIIVQCITAISYTITNYTTHLSITQRLGQTVVLVAVVVIMDAVLVMVLGVLC